MEKNTLLEQKQTNLMKALNREEGAYVPTYINSSNATISWTGKRAVDVIDDPVAFAKALNAVYYEMWVDALVVTGNTFTTKLERALPNAQTKFAPDGTTPMHLQSSPMNADEYDQLIANPTKFIADVLLPRRHPHLFESRDAAKESLKLYAEDRFYSLIQLSAAVEKDLLENHGVAPMVSMQKMIQTPLDMLFDFFRGFRGTLTDLRRQPEKVKAALDVIWEQRCAPTLEQLSQGAYPFAVQYPHIPAYLSPKQFDELYWVHEKQYIEKIAAGGGKVYMVMEGRWEKIWHRFLELPKDSCILHVDDDDIFKAHKELGHHQIISGGAKASDLRLKPFDKVKDDVKRVLDTCAPGGGFLFCTDKCWIAPGDVNQALIDTFNFVHEYTSK